MLWFLALNWRPPLATIVCFIQSVIKPKPTVNLMHVSPRFTTALRICMRFHRLGQWFDCVLCDRSNSSGFLVPHCITAAILNTFFTFPFKRWWRKTLQTNCAFAIFRSLACVSFCYVNWIFFHATPRWKSHYSRYAAKTAQVDNDENQSIRCFISGSTLQLFSIYGNWPFPTFLANRLLRLGLRTT